MRNGAQDSIHATTYPKALYKMARFCDLAVFDFILERTLLQQVLMQGILFLNRWRIRSFSLEEFTSQVWEPLLPVKFP